MSKEIFSRYELKYLIDVETYYHLRTKILPFMIYDEHGPKGKYNIVSLYFENQENKIYYETREGLAFRQKLRLRAYNQAALDENAFFEIKQKHRGRVNKRRTKIVLQDAYNYLERKQVKGLRVSNKQIFNEIQSFQSLYHLEPKLVVSYDRQAFQGTGEGNLRVTFDYNLKCRRNDLRLEHGPGGELFLDPSLVVLEVKVTNSVPFWLAGALSELGCYKNSFSKYCTAIEFMDKGGNGHGLNSTNYRWTVGNCS